MLALTVFVASVPSVARGVVARLPTNAAATRSTARMQYGGYGQQQGGYGQQGGYAQQGGYGQQGGYAQQGGYDQQAGPQILLHGTQGVTGHNQHIFGREKANYMNLPYTVRVGDEHVLGRYNMMMPEIHVSRVQCIVQVAPDGTPYLYSCGKPATGCRQGPGAPWFWVQKGQSQALASGSQISLDVSNPEAAVFTCEIGNQGGAYGQQGGQQQPGQLPYPWEQQVDQQSGQTYYYNPQTGQAQWEAPF